jgi:hypothetical protein
MSSPARRAGAREREVAHLTSFPGAGLTVAVALLAPSPAVATVHPAALLAIVEELRALRVPDEIDGVPDYSAAAVDRQKRALRTLAQRFDRLAPEGWTRHDRVDYLLLRSELDRLEYVLYVERPTSRNPNFYLSSISSAGMLSGAALSRLGRLVSQPPPFDRGRTERILEQMRSVPPLLTAARANLTEADAPRAEWALETLKGTLEGSRRFAQALAPHVPKELRGEISVAAERMGEAFDGYERWLRDNLDQMGEPRPAGRKLYDWILRNVWLLPYDAEDILRMGEQELARLQAFTAFEEKRNEGQPKLVAAATTREYATRTEQEARRIRAFLEEKDAITIPSLVGPYRRTVMPDYLQAFALWNALSGYRTGDGGAVKYAVPETHPFRSTYWEAIMRTDPATNIFHDGIPGHHFQGLLAAENPCPVRRGHNERFKSEGWATYWEEAAVQLGYYDDRPRSRELIYSYLRLRALRVIVDVKMALGEMTKEEAVATLMSTPMDRRIAREEVDDFFAAPTGGIVYLIGKLQIESLLSKRRRQLGDDFRLRTLHDELMTAGWVPLALTEWEMTGESRAVQILFEDRRPLPRSQSGEGF